MLLARAIAPFARPFDHAAGSVLAFLHAHPRVARIANRSLRSVQRWLQRKRNLAALAAMREMDDNLLRDVGVNRIAVARARLAPRRCDPIAVLRKEAGLR